MFDSDKIKSDFPIFDHHPGLVYLDSAATSLKPSVVISKLKEYYEQYSANVHRGLYEMAGRATDEYEETRQVVARFINAASPEEIIFTHGTTEAINLLANSTELAYKDGEEIVTTIMEHHSNFVPWQQLAKRTGAKFTVLDINNEGHLNKILPNPPFIQEGTIHADSSFFKREVGRDLSMSLPSITKNTKILALTYISNVLGTINPIKEIIRKAKEINPQIIVIVDAAQATGHLPIDVQDIGCDFLTFSAHKMLGPTGVGVLWGRRGMLAQLSPVQFGGEMVREVDIENTTWNDIPHRFEAGTPDISGVIAFKKAIRYLDGLGIENIRAHEQKLMTFAVKWLSEEFGEQIKIFGPKDAADRGSVLAFTLKNYHPHDIAQILSNQNIAVRAGHHCAMPLHTRLGISASTRLSLHVYNTQEDINTFIAGLKKVTVLLQN